VTPGLDWQRRFIEENILAIAKELGGAKRRIGFRYTERQLSRFGGGNYRLATVYVRKGKGRKDTFFVFRPGVFVNECRKLGIDGTVCSLETVAFLWQIVGFMLRLFLQQTKPAKITFHSLDALQSVGMTGDALTKHMISSHMITSSGLVNGTLRAYTDAIVAGSHVVRLIFQQSLSHRVTLGEIGACLES
jgi:hypothetical protein